MELTDSATKPPISSPRTNHRRSHKKRTLKTDTSLCIPYALLLFCLPANTFWLWRQSFWAAQQWTRTVFTAMATTRAANQRLRRSREREVPTLRAINTEPRSWWLSWRREKKRTCWNASRRTTRRRDPRVEAFALVFYIVVLFWTVSSLWTRCQLLLAMYIHIYTLLEKQRLVFVHGNIDYQFNN